MDLHSQKLFYRSTRAEYIVQNMAGKIFVHACHILKRAETCLVASQIKRVLLAVAQSWSRHLMHEASFCGCFYVGQQCDDVRM